MSDAKPRRRRAAAAGHHGGGHHGGAWKVAYADFATAMMAFFLLMWILNAASKDKKQALANFFRAEGPFRIASASVGGGVVQGGAGVMKDLSKFAVKPNAGEAELNRARKELEEKIKQSPELKEYAGQVNVRIAPEGLVIDMHEESGHELFAVGSAKPSPGFEKLLAAVADTIAPLAFPIQIEGHTDARPYGAANAAYSNWELSADRANSSRRVLEAHGVAPPRVASVVGHADRMLAAPGDPLAAVNRRITITLLRMDDGEGEQDATASDATAANTAGAEPEVAEAPVTNLASPSAAEPADTRASPRALPLPFAPLGIAGTHPP